MTRDIPRGEPFASSDVPWTEWSEVPRFGMRWRHLSRAALGDDYRVGVAIEELPDGRQSAPAHYHMLEEEHVFVLEGRMDVRIGAETHPVGPGDYVCFPAGQAAGHCLVNRSGVPCRYVIIGENNPNDVVVYPESGKVLVRSLGRRALFDMAARRGYWDGEDTGLPAGVAPPADEATPPAAPVSPKRPIASAAVPLEERSTGTRFGGGARHLTHAAVGPGYHVGVLVEAPAPGRQLAPRHYHMQEEEHALILEGEVTLIAGERRFVMKPGDFVSFAAGAKLGHAFLNSGEGPCRYLMIGERKPYDVCVYPDSNKVMVAALAEENDIFDMAGRRRYWDGEDTG